MCHIPQKEASQISKQDKHIYQFTITRSSRINFISDYKTSCIINSNKKIKKNRKDRGGGL